MRINILVNEVAGGWEPTDARLGGTEEAVVRWAEDLTKLGHRVVVYRNSNNINPTQLHNGVRYEQRGLYLGNGDVCINIKSSDIPPLEPTLYLTNETNATDLDLSKYDGVVWPSQWAAKNIRVNNDNVYIVPHGYDPNEIYPSRKVKKQCLYASSPDRGLDFLLDIWDKVHLAHPDATLFVTYGAKRPDVKKWLNGVYFLGDLDENQMNELYRESDVWCHPCTGVELFCITGLKAQAAGCVPVIIPAMALDETVKWGVKTTKEDYAKALIKALNNTELLRTGSNGLTYPTYADSAKMLEKLLLKIAQK